MTLRAIAATVTLFASTFAATAQQPSPVAQFTDPANLRGERVKPRDGRELPIDQGAHGLEQMLRKLNTRASLMLIVAHPDDEDGGMLTYYSRGLGARVAVLTLTRGEGGQNAMTGDFEDALGLLRTQELLSADRYLGVDQFFGTEVDFGFSKTKEEAFKKWTHERVLYDAVRSIRLYRPLVIAAVFIGGVTDGHGQHQVSGQIAQEAFKAAADPTVFPDMIAEGILPWQALKVYARVPMQSISDKGLFDYATGKYTAPRFENYVTGEVTTTTPSADVIVHEGTVDKLLSDNPTDPPRTYVQFARIGLGLQKSQVGSGMRVPPAGEFDVAYHLYGSALCSSPTHIKDCHPERSEGSATPPATSLPSEHSGHNPESASFFDGIDTSIEGIGRSIPSAPKIAIEELEALDSEMKQLSDWNAREAQRQRLPELLADALKRIDLIISSVDSSQLPAQEKADALHELRIKRVQLNDALVFALGLELKSSMDTDGRGDVSVYHSLSVKTQLTGHAGDRAKVLREWLQNELSTGEDKYDGNGKSSWDVSGSFPVGKTLNYPYAGLNQFVTRPYFRRHSIEQPVYELAEPRFRNAPAAPAALSSWAAVEYQGTEITLGSVVKDGVQPVKFVSWVNLSFPSQTRAIPPNPKHFSLTVSNMSAPSAWTVSISDELVVPPDVTTKPRPSGSNKAEKTFDLSLNTKTLPPPFNVRAVALLSGGVSNQVQADVEGYRPVGYGDLPRTNYYTPATVRIVPVDLNLPTAHRIAYLPGTGDAVSEALASINLKPDTLTVADLTPARLSQYDTVILGVRTYNAHPDLHGAPTQALLDYARNGGNVLVQYQTAEFTAADAPYPLTLGYSAEKVVDEADPVQLLDPSAPFLTTPNKVTPADFNNWVEERGHGFLSSWDSHYTALTETHDPDQDPQRGGLITTNIGKGRWTYCAFALYRQLPEAVPGAFRLFVNLIDSPAR